MSGSGVAAAKANRPICKDRGRLQTIVTYRSSQPRVLFCTGLYFAKMTSKTMC